MGAFLVGTERRIASGARRLNVSNAQWAVVERARSLLRHPIVFSRTGEQDLHPERSQLNRLRELVRSVPSGQPRELVPGYHWAERVITTLDELEAVADVLDLRVNKFQGTSSLFGERLVELVRQNINELANAGPSTPHEWEWEWHDELIPLVTKQVDVDDEFHDNVNDYLRLRWLLLAYREAFLAADGAWRAEAWAALLEKISGAPHNPIKAAYRSGKYRRAVIAAKLKADNDALEIVRRVDSMAY